MCVLYLQARKQQKAEVAEEAFPGESEEAHMKRQQVEQEAEVDEDLSFNASDVVKSANDKKKKKFKGFTKPQLNLWTIGGLNLTQTIIKGFQEFKDNGKKQVSHTFWQTLRTQWRDERNTDAWKAAHPEEARERDQKVFFTNDPNACIQLCLM